jgi:hypothetical protein
MTAHPGLSACRVDYSTRRTQAEELLDSPALFEPDLPDCVTERCWQVVRVDAPSGRGMTLPAG